MDTNKLMELITKEVMKRLNSVEDGNKDDCKKLLLINPPSDNDYITVRETLKEKYAVEICENTDCDIEKYDGCYLWSIKNSEMVRIALGMPESPVENLVMEFLLRGKRVYIFEDGVEYKKYIKSSPCALTELYRNYEKKMVEFGINFIKDIKNIDTLNKYCEAKETVETVKPLEGKKEQDIESFLTDKKLITENDLRKINKEAKAVVISAKAVITPLAQDFIRINRLNIRRA